MSESSIGKWYPSPRYLLRKRLLIRCLRMIKCKGKSLLEIGYGAGDMLCTYHEHGMKVYGYDFSELAKKESLKRISSKGYKIGGNKGITLFESESEAYNRKYNVLVACEVLEHIEDDVAMLRRWNASIASDGYLIISVPARMKRWSISDELAGHYRRYEKNELIGKLYNTGFDCKTIWSYPVPINGILDYLMNREHKIKKSDLKEKISKEDKTKLSGINRKSGVFARALSRPMLIYPWHLIQMLFVNTDLGSGYVVMAKKND